MRKEDDHSTVVPLMLPSSTLATPAGRLRASSHLESEQSGRRIKPFSACRAGPTSGLAVGIRDGPEGAFRVGNNGLSGGVLGEGNLVQEIELSDGWKEAASFSDPSTDQELEWVSGRWCW